MEARIKRLLPGKEHPLRFAEENQPRKEKFTRNTLVGSSEMNPGGEGPGA